MRFWLLANAKKYWNLFEGNKHPTAKNLKEPKVICRRGYEQFGSTK
jgi:hypothetical protein